MNSEPGDSSPPALPLGWRLLPSHSIPLSPYALKKWSNDLLDFSLREADYSGWRNTLVTYSQIVRLSFANRKHNRRTTGGSNQDQDPPQRPEQFQGPSKVPDPSSTKLPNSLRWCRLFPLPMPPGAQVGGAPLTPFPDTRREEAGPEARASQCGRP